jgi:osmoprotectant transport system ATP-binding protein
MADMGTDVPAISLHGVAKTYPNGTVAVHELSFEVPKGRIAALVGPSGCGKTTTMRMINRLIEPTSGEIRINGQDVMDADPVTLRRSIGYVIQQVGLFPHRTIAENVATVCQLNGWERNRTRDRVREMLHLVGLDPHVYADRYPAQLSGGQRQRVGVARALASDPPVVLMDEPFGAVDPVARGRLQEQFLALQRQLDTTVVLVTHDIDEAVMLGDRLAVMRQGGYLEQYAEPGVILGAPATAFVADFVGGDRSIKRLALTDIDLSNLDPVREVAGQPTIPSDTRLRAALVVLLDSPTGSALVTGGDGHPIGVLTMAQGHRAMQWDSAA